MKRLIPKLINDSTEPLTFFQTCLGLLGAPALTIQRLLSEEEKPFLMRIVLTLLLLISAPLAFLLYRYDYLATRINIVLIFNIVLLITASLYIIFERLLFLVLKVDLNLYDAFASFCYALAPLIPLLILAYGLDLLLNGRLSVSTYIITGVADAEHTVLANFLYAHLIAKALFLVVLFHYFRREAGISSVESATLTAMSSIPFYFAFALALIVSNSLNSQITLRLNSLLFKSLQDIGHIFGL